MKNLIFFVGLAVICFAATGWYLEWYTITDLQGLGGRSRVQIELDTQKIRQDAGGLLEKGQERLQTTIERTQKEPEEE